jgi:hypothetical protein
MLAHAFFGEDENDKAESILQMVSRRRSEASAGSEDSCPVLIGYLKCPYFDHL